MNLTLANRFKLCTEVLMARSGHNHISQEKQLSTFMRGYQAGVTDAKLETEGLDALQEKVIEWAEAKGIFAKATPETQHSKTLEEVRELTDALRTNEKPEIIDAIGDIAVTLIIQAHMQGVSLTECLESAYSVISKRTGKMIDGVFVKD